MAKLYMLSKFVTFLGFNLLLMPTAKGANELMPKAPPEFMFFVFVFLMFLPEMSMSIKSMRDWVKTGIEDGDGILNKRDLKDLLVYWASMWMLRVFVLSYLFQIFYGVETEFQFTILPFFGALGAQGIAAARNIFQKKIKET